MRLTPISPLAAVRPTAFHCWAAALPACNQVMAPSGVCAPVTSAASWDQDAAAACASVRCGSPASASVTFLATPVR